MAESSVPTAAGSRSAIAEAQRAVMQRFPTGVAVVTAFDPLRGPRGMTVSSLCSLSLDPPMLLVCLRVKSATLDAVTSSGQFAVNLLHGKASSIAELFAAAVPDRFARAGWRSETQSPHAAGPHLAPHAHAILDCRLVRCHPAGDHTVVFGEITDITEHGDPAPLLYGLRRYTQWPHAD